MKRFLICLSIVVIIVCGGYLYSYFARTNDTNVEIDGEKYYLTWEKYPKATEYEVYLDDILLTTEENKIDITEYLIEDRKYDVTVKTTTVEDGEVVVYEEDYQYRASQKSDFKRKTFFMNGKTYDYNIESLKEYEVFVWYNILYRNESARFYNSCSSINVANVNRITSNYIVSYPEYDGVEIVGRYGTRESRNIYKVYNLDYYLPTDFTLSVASCTREDNIGLYNYKQDKTQYTKATAYNQEYEKAATSSQRHFPIDSEDLQEVVVYNSEQLFMAVQYGARPVFGKQNSVAETIYNNARDVLEEINNSDSLTDYQKALNIYRYICMNVVYDHILVDYMSDIGDSTVKTFGKFSPFYLEGVFYDMDNQVAVCDGLSKAFALMCRIEGIEATKINGKADGQGVIEISKGEYTGGEHAWNKVKIGSNYHIVDTTWGVVPSTSKMEYLTHDYFLVSAEELKAANGLYTHRATYEANSAQTVSYNYYQNATIGYYSLYVENSTQLENIAKYMKENNIANAEIKLSPAFIAGIEANGVTIQTYINQTFTKLAGQANPAVIEDICLIHPVFYSLT